MWSFDTRRQEITGEWFAQSHPIMDVLPCTAMPPAGNSPQERTVLLDNGGCFTAMRECYGKALHSIVIAYWKRMG